MGAGAATIASAGAAVGIGNVFSSLIHSVARNPSLAKQSFGYAILGFALTEAIALFAPMMAFLISSYEIIIYEIRLSARENGNTSKRLAPPFERVEAPSVTAIDHARNFQQAWYEPGSKKEIGISRSQERYETRAWGRG
ncbi:V-ATPase proteolipid subunit C-like domain [Dillenia turbinata]|uniref:ATP synthase subunit 9, mitochondrial n=1 Tax=Dillenia turbinata TaxID=194707 RepID=A0AAN8V2E3_9MAGN